MEKLIVDWHSSENTLLLNPRLPTELSARVTVAWEKASTHLAGDLAGHIGLLTSGSSGSAKLVLLSKKAMLAAAEGANNHLLCGKSDTWLKSIPHFHVGGLGIFARAQLSGARVVNYEGWSAQEVYDLAVKEKATLISLVPAQLFDFVSLGLSAPPTLRAALIGGGALRPDLYNKSRALSWPVLPSYGLTECGSQVATASPDSLNKNEPSLQLLPHIEAQVSPAGKLMLKSAALLTGYVNIDSGEITDPKANGWFTTEDVAELNGQQLQIIGRTQDFLKIGGESVDFAALEKTFENIWQELGLSHALRADAAIIPVPDHRLGATIVLVVDGLTSSQSNLLVEKFNSAVMPYERIRHTCNLPKIPRSELGSFYEAKPLQSTSGFLDNKWALADSHLAHEER